MLYSNQTIRVSTYYTKIHEHDIYSNFMSFGNAYTVFHEWVRGTIEIADNWQHEKILFVQRLCHVPVYFSFSSIGQRRN